MAFFVLIGRMALKWLYTLTLTHAHTNTHYDLFLAANFRSSQFLVDSFTIAVLCSVCVCVCLLLLNEWMLRMLRIRLLLYAFFYWYYKVHINLMRVLLELFDRYFVKYKCAPNITTTVTVHLLGISLEMCSGCWCCCRCRCCYARIHFLHSSEQNVTVSVPFYIFMCAFVCFVETAEWKFFLLPLDCSHASEIDR